MISRLKVTAGFVLLSLAMHAQHPNVLVAEPFGSGLPTEPAIAINPASPDQFLAAGMPFFIYYSADGGTSWVTEIVSSPYGVNCDPVLLIDNSNRCYFIHLPDSINRVVCHRSDYPGGPWNMESFAAYDGIHEVDKPWASYDPVNDAINLTWTYFDDWGSNDPDDSTCIYYSRSADGGSTWSVPSRVSDLKGNATGGIYSTHGSYNTVGPSGEVYVCWFSPNGLMFDRSPDGGTTWLPDDINITGSRITWIYSIPGVNLGVTFPFMACDRSGGPFNGNIYISWADKRNGSNNTDVFIVRSIDGGNTWSAPIKVNDDGATRHQFFPTLTVDQVTGKVWLAFFDRRNYSDSNTDLYMAVSEDGGNTFVNFKVSESSFIPYNSVFFGHYIGLAAHNDHVLPVWNRMDDGQNSIMGAIIDPDIVGIEEMPSRPLTRLLSYPNPFSESSFISFRLRSSSRLTLKIYDLMGKETAVLIRDQEYPGGKHVFRVNAKELGLKPGAYLVKLQAGENNIVSKILFTEK